VSNKFKGKSNRGLYGDVIMELDWSVGEIIKSVEINGLTENTIIIFTSDNGPWLAYGNHSGSAFPFREGKGTGWEGGQREPFIIKYPKEIKSGTTINSPLMAIDILPSLAEVTNSKLPETPIDGNSAWSLLTGKTNESPQEAYFFYYRVNELFGVRYGKWKLYFPHKYRTMNGQEPGKDGLPGEYKMIDLAEIELYNLESDPSETNNVAAKNPKVVEKIQQLADTMRSRLGDSLKNMEGLETRAPGMID
jgi:arylsulfatase